MKRDTLRFAFFALLMSSHSAIGADSSDIVVDDKGQDIVFTAPISEVEREWLKVNPILRVGISIPNFPPFTIVTKKNELEGISADNLFALQKKLGVTFQILRFKNRELAFDALKRGEIDLIDAVTPAEATKHDVSMTAEYSYTRIALYSKTGSLLNLDLRKPTSVIASTQDGLVSVQALNRFRDNTIKLYASPYQAIASVIDGVADAYLGDTVSTSYLINQSFNNQLVTNISVDSTDTPIAFAIMPENKYINELISRQLNSLNHCQKMGTLNWWVSTLKCNYGDLANLLTSDEKNLLSLNKLFRIAVSEDIAPYALFDSSGQFGGTMSDILELVRLNSGLNFEVIRTQSLHSAQEMLDTGKADLSILPDTQELAKKYLFTQPIITAPYTIITRISDYENFTLTNSTLNTIALPRSDSLEKFIRENYSNLNVTLTESVPEALNTVRDGQADFTITSTNQARYYLSFKYANTLKTSGVLTDMNALIGIATTPANPDLISIIQKSLIKISPKEIASISSRWRANTATDNLYWEGISLRFYQIFSGLFVLLLATCIWIVYLRKIIFKKTSVRKALQEQLSLVQNIVNSIPQPIYVRDRQGELLLFNTAYAQALVTSANHNNDPTLLDKVLNPTVLAEWQQDYAEAISSGGPVTNDQHLILNDRTLDVYHWIQPLLGDEREIMGVVCGWLDIGDRLRIIEEIRQAKAEADKANSAKTVFLATMSHEIRTPMNAIIGMLELALNRNRDATKTHESIQIAHESALSLLDLLGGILDISSIESGQIQLHWEATTLRQIVESAVEIFSFSAESKGLWINTQFDKCAERVAGFDRLKVKQVLSNLLSNAIKFTQSGGLIIRVSGKCLEQGNFEFVISVQDTGPGISPSDMSTLFVPFSQATISHNRGAGLGLSISQSLSRIMGGDLLVDSVMGSGTTVTFTGVAMSNNNFTSAPQLARTVTPSTINTQLNILIVDDHLPSLKLLKEQIELLGHLPLVAHDGLEALFKWEDHDFDFVITDCNMPELDGIGLAEEIRKLEITLQIRPCTIIGVTASARAEDMQACLKAGMNICLLKPVNLTRLAHYIPALSTSLEIECPTTGNYMAGISESKRNIIIAELMISNDEDILALEACLTSLDYHGMTIISHKLKSSSRLMNSNELLDQCERLELSLSNRQDTNVLQTTVFEIRRILNAFR